MKTKKQLGKLKRNKDVRSVWSDEARDFTPWLAENIGLIGDAIGLELEVESQEERVGPFRADIVCLTGDNEYVLIENQLEKTDHDHLGKVLTYAAGLDVVTVVWVAGRFVEQHRAAMDWLNKKIGQDVNFFGVEVELLKIDDSKEAPNFTVVVKPNEWVKGSGDTEMTATKRALLSYWEKFTEKMKQKPGKVNPTKPFARSVMGFSSGHGGVRLHLSVKTSQHSIGVRVKFHYKHQEASKYYPLMQKNSKRIKDAIQKEMNGVVNLDWKGGDEKKSAYISLWKKGPKPLDESQWDEQHAWLYQGLYAFHRVFDREIKSINPDDLVDEETDDDGDSDDG